MRSRKYPLPMFPNGSSKNGWQQPQEKQQNNIMKHRQQSTATKALLVLAVVCSLLASLSTTLELQKQIWSLSALEFGMIYKYVNPEARHNSIENGDGTHKSGVLACLTDREYIAQALALAESLSLFSPSEKHANLELQLYHTGTLSYFLQCELEKYPFVRVTDLSSSPQMDGDGDDTQAKYSTIPHEGSLYTTALQTTDLQHVLLVRPSIMFFQHPLDLLESIQEEPELIDRNCDDTCVISTDDSLTQAVLAVEPSLSTRIQNYPTNSAASVVLNGTSMPVASLYTDSHYDGLWAHPSHKFLSWAHPDPDSDDELAFIRMDSDGQSELSRKHSIYFENQRKHFSSAKRLLVMDRPVKWVAFDGGYHSEIGTMNSVGAAKQSQQMGASILNIDLVSTSNGKLVALHDDTTFAPFQVVPESELSKPISSMTGAEALDLTIPCISDSMVDAWMARKPNRKSQCVEEKVASASDFIRILTGTELILDLKASTAEQQAEQAREICQMLESDSLVEKKDLVSVRFFSPASFSTTIMMEDDLEGLIVPEHALSSFATDDTIRNLPYYVNTPSALACLQVSAWIRDTTAFKNKNIAGCFVLLNDSRVKEGWDMFVRKHEVPLNISVSLAPQPKTICDVPRKQKVPDGRLLDEEYRRCIHEGYEYIHHALPVSTAVDPGVTSMPNPLSETEQTALATIKSRLSTRMHAPLWSQYVSHWGYMLSSDWDQRQDWWLRGTKGIVEEVEAPDNEDAIFRCVTKALVTMLFFRLEEIGRLRLNDLAFVRQNPPRNVTWMHILSNRAGLNLKGKSIPVGEFAYSSIHWKYVAVAVEKACGMSFVAAMQHYVLDPMGMLGSFDVNTKFPPYSARGYLGPLDDLLLLGSTLAGGGVSPKTRKKVLSPASVERMLENSGVDDQSNSFEEDTIVKMVNNQKDVAVALPLGVVDGYGLGVWRVNGWRTDAQGRPIRGWLLNGNYETFVYFDMTGLVVAMHITSVFIGNRYLIPTFLTLIRDLGNSFASDE